MSTVVLALAGVSAVAVAAPRTSPPLVQPAASASPTRHEITTDALLQPTDLPQPVDVQLSESGLRESIRLDQLLTYCRTDQGYPDGVPVSLLSRSQTLVRKNAPRAMTKNHWSVTQESLRLTPDGAAQLLKQPG